MSHTCKNLVLTCMDFRFPRKISEWAESQGLTRDYDLVSLAGAQKSILDSDSRATLLKQVELSVELHGTREFIIIAHRDCGAYGGSKSFNSWEEERAKYSKDLELAKNVIKEKFPKIDVKKMILNFDESGNVGIEEA